MASKYNIVENGGVVKRTVVANDPLTALRVHLVGIGIPSGGRLGTQTSSDVALELFADRTRGVVLLIEALRVGKKK